MIRIVIVVGSRCEETRARLASLGVAAAQRVLRTLGELASTLGAAVRHGLGNNARLCNVAGS